MNKLLAYAAWFRKALVAVIGLLATIAVQTGLDKSNQWAAIVVMAATAFGVGAVPNGQRPT